MLTLYRRHLKCCAHREEGREYRRCKCPLWVDGFLGKREIRQSLRLRDWDKGQEKIRGWEAEGMIAPQQAEPTTIEQACAAFLADAKARELREATLYKYRLLFAQLKTFAITEGLRYVNELELGMLRRFRAGWKDHNLAAVKKLERLRAFLRFAEESGWIESNPARKLKNPKVTDPPTLPLEPEQVSNILLACADYPDRANAARLCALVLLLRYSGLRIRDAVTLRRDRIQAGKLFLYQAKTGTAVWCPLPEAVAAALEAIPAAGLFFFWSGESNPKSCVGDYQRALRRLFLIAGKKNDKPGVAVTCKHASCNRRKECACVCHAHAHRFRDTFAVELLKAGVPLDRVSVLLGHKSVKVTEKHYSPWVRARQEQLEQDVRRTWDTDLVASGPTKGTPGVHGKGALPN